MNDFVQVLPYAPPPPPNPNAGWDGLVMTWTDWTGVVWQLTSGTSGILLKEGVEGLDAPRHDVYRDESPALAGSYWRGHRTLARDVFWPLRLFQDSSSKEYIALKRAFYKGFRPDRTGVWSVRSAMNETRTLVCRYEKGLEEPAAKDPTMFGWRDLGITLVAEQPFWAGTPIPYTWEIEDQDDFLAVDGSRPPFISTDNTLTTATITNPGDEDTYVIWTAYGPFDTLELEANGQVIGIPFAVPGGQHLTIDTRPTEQTAILSTGVDKTADLSSYGFAPIPPGVDVPLGITMDGSGKVTASLTPLYREAY